MGECLIPNPLLTVKAGQGIKPCFFRELFREGFDCELHTSISLVAMDTD